ncbi:flap endonuclease GEN homolog 1 [Synchiropus picturatus]
MGVHDLWSILEPVRESVPLYSLCGKTLAVDLSLWVCEAQHVQAMMGRVTKPHLRNLFFRVSSLTLMGVKLVFVMEGDAPKLKAETMKKRTESRFAGSKKTPAPRYATNTGRGRFNAILRECAEMLDYMGVPWVRAAGEAEAMCAYLDSQRLVDGCITNDGDVFLYGARTVYRNFNMNSKDPQVECYRTSQVQTELHLSRENLVGLAILLGCDYIPKGISGVGKELALKLIQSLKEETLLERLSRWKEENAVVSEVVVKKVPHCHICRHPGSLKVHERRGCLLCDSSRFCQPQDFNYECPCDWHRHEQTRQASSVEAVVRKKTLANSQFPFTEIISEFLVSKDKPVSSFKRRLPNMLLLQKFAFDKMEWPKHYTSEKVLVLITYAELMNRKHGRNMPPQITPLRILKPRVRNSVSCFEVVWTTPDHYVFPEDRPAEDQQEVRSVEEESLFRVAFPELVESYMREKALAEENKTKRKKTKSKKEKTLDEPSDLSDLMTRLTLQSSSSLHSQSHPRSALSSTESETVDLASGQEELPLSDCSSTPQSRADSETASPSVSSVIDALHLSEIDWDALSFTSSPTPQDAPKANPEAKDEEEGGHFKVKCIDEEQSVDGKAAVCSSGAQLRERVLLRNSVRALDQVDWSANNVHKQLDYDLPSQELKPNICVKEQKPVMPRLMPLVLAPPGKPKKAPQKYKFVKTALLPAAPQRCHSDPGHSDRAAPPITKKSVCLSVCSSSDESDVENKQPQRRTKLTSMNKIKGNIPPLLPLKTAPGSATADLATKPQLPAAATDSWQEVPPPSILQTDVFIPSSPVAVLDSDDSVVCSDSPLPLAERLRLRFQK